MKVLIIATNLIVSFLFTIILPSSFPRRGLTAVSSCRNLSLQKKIDLPLDDSHPVMEDGRHYPFLPHQPERIANLLSQLELELLDSLTSNSDLPCLAHQQQVIYRVLSEKISLSNKVLVYIPENLKNIVNKHLFARRQFLSMAPTSASLAYMPRWNIINPEPINSLLSYYKKAENATGIDWEVLAAINLVETGMGRIDGISIANAQGPMQFLPTTWKEPGIGLGGNIRDPHDSIMAAARYLVRRGGLANIRKGLLGYNNSDYYGKAVLAYADLLRNEPRTIKSLYYWEIHYRAGSYDLWLPVGYSEKKTLSISNYIKLFPASVPPPTTLNHYKH